MIVNRCQKSPTSFVDEALLYRMLIVARVDSRNRADACLDRFPAKFLIKLDKL